MNVKNIISCNIITFNAKIINESIKFCFFFFILSTDQSFQMILKHNGYGRISVFFDLSLIIMVPLTNK